MAVISQILNLDSEQSGRGTGLTKLHDNFPKIIRMATPAEEADITHLPLITLITPKPILLNIPHTLQHKAQYKQDHPSNIPPGPKLWLFVF